MEAKVHHKQDAVIVDLKGYIDIETAKPFEEACMRSIANSDKKIVFNLEELNFVGSNGLLPFVKTLSTLRDQGNMNLKFCKVSSEFKKLFSASPLKDVDIFQDEADAILNQNPIIEEVA